MAKSRKQATKKAIKKAPKKSAKKQTKRAAKKSVRKIGKVAAASSKLSTAWKKRVKKAAAEFQGPGCCIITFPGGSRRVANKTLAQCRQIARQFPGARARVVPGECPPEA
jgi:hypothetical protein